MTQAHLLDLAAFDGADFLLTAGDRVPVLWLAWLSALPVACWGRA
jgi:hypothetical protein